MNLELTSPGESRKKQKKRALTALLEAHEHLPTLVTRLSTGFITIDEETTSRWAGWIDALRGDPAWQVIEPLLEMPEAWPQAWRKARAAGLSDASQHHSAIFFTRLFERAASHSRFELAKMAWEEALISWTALGDAGHLKRCIDEAMGDELDDDQLQAVLSTLLEDQLDYLGQICVEALRLSSWDAPPGRRSLRFARQCLARSRQFVEEIPDDDDRFSFFRGLQQGVEANLKRPRQLVIAEMDRQLQNIDTGRAETDEFLQIFDGALRRCEYLEFPPELDRAILRRGLGMIWDLREIERDEELAIIAPMVERLEPCTARLRELGGDEFFGLEGAVADLLVFKGEESLRIDDRQAAFEKAIEICPGHRNASRLLSYLLLERANRNLLKTAALPDATAKLGVMRRRIQPLVDRADELIGRAEELYPDNDLVDRYRADLDAEINRFQLATENPDED